MTDFVHLHVHSDYSIYSSTARIDKLIEKAAELKMNHIALTDSGNMFGTIEFHKKCGQAGLKDIIGAEVQVLHDSPDISHSDANQRKYHLVLLARNVTGYRNLMKLLSTGCFYNNAEESCISSSLLEENSYGLIGLSSGFEGSIASCILEGDIKGAYDRADYYREIFGMEIFYLELQIHGIRKQAFINIELIDISRNMGIPLVATNNVHYVEKDDSLARDILNCIGRREELKSYRNLKFIYPELYLKTKEEMSVIFSDVPDALEVTLKIAEMCEFEIPEPDPELPNFNVPHEFSQESYLKHLSEKGVETMYGEITKEIQDRLDYELSIINFFRYTAYFLLVWDYVRYAREMGIPVGPGRGASGGSLIAYVLRITDVDPFKHGLIFEFFFNPQTGIFPDFNIDFCMIRRDEVIDYIMSKYGRDHVAQIATFGTFRAARTLREVAQALEIPKRKANRIVRRLPVGFGASLNKAFENSVEMRKFLESSKEYGHLFEVSKKIEGLVNSVSTHSVGLALSRNKLSYYTPLFQDIKSGKITTQYSWKHIRECGLVKVDLLGFKELTILQSVEESIRKKKPDFDIVTIPENDPKTYEMLSEGKSKYVFQLQSTGIQRILRRLKPGKFEELVALNALFRPNCFENLYKYIELKSGKQKMEYPIPDLESVLKETYGIVVYQEQIIKIANIMAGFSFGKADLLRKILGKKKIDLVREEEKKFIESSIRLGYSRESAMNVFDNLIQAAGTACNKAHAAAYTLITYRMAYLKANYPDEFMKGKNIKRLIAC